MSPDTDDPAIQAIITFVEAQCAVSVAEGSGFHNQRTVDERRAEARRVFIVEMNKLNQDAGP